MLENPSPNDWLMYSRTYDARRFSPLNQIDMNRRFRAFDAETGQKLWEAILGGNTSVSTITYAVNGTQYITVMTGDNLKVPELAAEFPEIKTPRRPQRDLHVCAPAALAKFQCVRLTMAGCQPPTSYRLASTSGPRAIMPPKLRRPEP